VSDAARKTKIKSNTLDWDVMGGALFGGAPAFVVDLRGGDVAVAEQLLNLADVTPASRSRVAVVARREWVL